MTNIRFDSKNLELNIEGHAGYAEKGKDIVCSAVSILFYTLVESLESSGFLVKPLEKEVRDGSVRLMVHGKGAFTANIQLMFWQTMNGFELLANDYPDYVKLEIL